MEEHIKTDKVPYDIWISKGLVTVTETLGGVKTDYKYILRYLGSLIEEYELKVEVICYDPHNASAFMADLEEMGFTSLSVVQTARVLGDATEDFRLEILAGNVEVEGVETGSRDKSKIVPYDELLTWSIANAKTVSNSHGEIRIAKEKESDRIDAVAAVIDTWTEAMKEEYRLDINEIARTWLKDWDKYKEGGE